MIGCGSKRACHEQCSQITHVIDYWTVILESDDPLMMMDNYGSDDLLFGQLGTRVERAL